MKLYCAWRSFFFLNWDRRIINNIIIIIIFFILHLNFHGATVKCCFVARKRGLTPENTNVVHCHNKQCPSEPFLCSDLVLKR